MDHLGFTVESLEAFKNDVSRLAEANTALGGISLTATKENAARLELLQKCCMGAFQLSDPDGVLIDVSEVRPS